MNPNEPCRPELEQEIFDRLADGELTEAERRELLWRLDREPDGWRRCALAFLEAQCFREALGPLARRGDAVGSGHLVRPVRRTVRSAVLPVFLAMAAGFLLALGIGWRLGGWPGLVAPRAQMPEVDSEWLAGPVETTSRPALQAHDAQESSSPPRVLTVALPAEWTGTDRELHVPVIEQDHLDHAFLFPDAALVPAEIREALRRAGYQIRQSRALLPLPIQDGRHAVFPVDQVEIHYVGNHME